MPTLFKKCSCGAEWTTRDEFLSDRTIKLVGYQADFEELCRGLLLFNHLVCQTTVALEANQFADLYTGPVFRERAWNSENCPGYCLHRGNLDACPAVCECAHIREVLQVIRRLKAPEPHYQ